MRHTPSRRTDPYRHLVNALARGQGGVLSNAQIRALDIPWWFVRAEVRLGRWRRGVRCVVTHNGPLDEEGRLRFAVYESGTRAALDGISVLRRHGIDVRGDGDVHVIVPRGAGAPKLPGVTCHESRRFLEADVVEWGRLRQTTLPAATLHAALWARTDREAALFVTMAVNSRKVTVAQMQLQLLRVRRHRRRLFLRQLLVDLAGGVRSLGELDVARAMRSRGLPEPTRQSIRQRPSGKEYLDAEFEEYDLVLEVDGSQHDLPAERLIDLLRDLALVAEGRAVLRLPLIAWRLGEEAVLDALEAVFRSRGWVRAAA